MAGKDLEKFVEKYPTYIEALEMLEQKDQHIAELEQELAELKEKAIVPKFKIGQEVYSVFINRKYMESNEVCNLEITHIMRSKSGIFYQDNNKNAYWFNEKNTFLTEQEAQAKLKEIQGSIVGEDDEPNEIN